MSETPRDTVLSRIYKAINGKTIHPIIYSIQRRKISYVIGNDMMDITEPLEALYHYFADIEDEHWREKLCQALAVPKEMLFPSDVKKEGKYTFILDKKPRVYISGKITGLKESVYKNNFNSTELYLTGLGYDVVNPVSYPTDPNWKWEDYMKRDIKLLVGCDYIYLLEGWQDSDGASLEKYIADILKIKTLELDE